MSTDNLNQLDTLWERMDQEAAEAKFSHQAVVEVSRLYRIWDADKQRAARRALAGWLSSTNARKRFDALALIREFSAQEAASALEELKARLEREKGAEAAFELRKVNEVLGALSTEG